MKRSLFLVAVFVLSATQYAHAIARQPFHPAFSPDGKQIVYSDYILPQRSVIEPLSRELWIINSDSSGARKLTSGHHDTRPRWSPDGKRIAFTRGGDIWVVGADGRGLKNLTNSENVIEDMAEWTNDGKGLFFLRDRLVEMNGKWWETGFIAGHKNLATGVDSRVLDTEFSVSQIVPDPSNSDAAFVICHQLEPNGTPVEEYVYGTEVIATVNLKTSQVRTLFALDPQHYKDRRIEKIRCARGKILVEISGDWQADKMALLENGKLKFLPKMPADADISRDGTHFVSTAINRYSMHEDWGLRLYDIATQNELLNIETGITDPLILEAKDSFVRGNVHYDAARYPAALQEFSEAIRLNPRFASALYNRALCYWMTDDNDRAIADFDAVLALRPVDGDAVFQRGLALLAKGELDKAISDFTSATVLLTDKAPAYRKRAEAYSKKGFQGLADEDQKKARELEQ